MTHFLVRRLVQSVLLVFAISLVVFGLVQLVPGGPFDLLLSDPRVLAVDVQRLQRLMGLDRPFHERYLSWLVHAATLDLGESWQVAFGQPVTRLIADRLPHTMTLMGVSLVVSFTLAIPLGVYSALRRYSLGDYLITGLSFFGTSMPVFWLGLMAVIAFAVNLRWLPTSGVATPGLEGDWIDRLRHLVLPVAVLSLANLAQWSRFVRSSLLEVLQLDYLRTARAKGLRERIVVLRHALPNASLPLVTILGIELPTLFSGAVVTESIFAWPGMGRLYVQAVYASDWPVVQGVVMITALLVITGNLVADLLYAVLDPRIRYE